MDALLRATFDLMARGLADELGIGPIPSGAELRVAAEARRVERRLEEYPSLALAAALELATEDAPAPLYAIPVEQRGA